LEDLVYFKVLV